MSSNLGIHLDPYTVVLTKHSQNFTKLNSVANDCNFTNRDEVVKFLHLTHNQNTRVREHLLKEMTDTTSLTDMLRMARVCEGMVHSEELFKQYLESVKSVNQIDSVYHHQRNNSKNKHKGHGRAVVVVVVIIILNHGNLARMYATTVAPVTPS